MVIPFALFADGCHGKLFTDRRYRDIKAINLLRHSIFIRYGICGRLKKLCSVLFCILGGSGEKVQEAFSAEAYMNRHLAIFYRQHTLAVVCLIDMEH